MRTNRTLTWLRRAAFVFAAAAAPVVWALDAGAPAPALALPGLKDTVDLASLKGKVVYVDFWASWCGPCKQSFPFMNELQSRYGAAGLEVVAVNLDARRDDADRFLAEVPARFTVAFDAKGESARHFEVKAMPSSVLIGRDGKVVAAHKGFKDGDRKALEERIAQLVAAH
ncbi:MAG: TlpA family protein disulfide reductase [Ideonella sp.]|nr:TlpA family protein disulfide reductase [Ideonella sp.]